MSPTYIIWSIRLGGWISRSGGGSSDWKDAREFTHDEAIVYCKKQKSEAAVVSFPVNLDDVRSILS